MRNLRMLLNSRLIESLLISALSNAMPSSSAPVRGLFLDVFKLDHIQFHRCTDPVLAEPLAKGCSVSELYLQYHEFTLLEA
jgi:hypothetical protein